MFGTLAPDSINYFESFAGDPPVQHQYSVKAAAVATLTGTGAHIAGDLVEQSPANGVAHTIHAEGDVTCGVSVHS